MMIKKKYLEEAREILRKKYKTPYLDEDHHVINLVLSEYIADYVDTSYAEQPKTCDSCQ